MLGAIKKLLGHKNQSSDVLSSAEREERIKVATCVILIESATADEHFSNEEQQKVINILKTEFNLTDDAVRELIEESETQRQNTSDLWYFTDQINQNFTNEEKYELMEKVWEVIYSDGTLDKYENYMAHKLSNLLRIDHSKFIELKMQVKEKLNIQ